MLRSFGTLSGVNPGFDTQQRPDRAADGSRHALRQTTRSASSSSAALVARIAAIPGVESAGAISFLPLAGLGAAHQLHDRRPAAAAARPGAASRTCRVADNGYFQHDERAAAAADGCSPNARCARSRTSSSSTTRSRGATSPNEDPLGKSLVINMTDPNVPTEIIGIVGDVEVRRLRDRGAADDLLAASAAGLQRDDVHAAHRRAIRRRSRRSSSARSGRSTRTSRSRTCARWISGSRGRSSQARFSSTLLTTFAALALMLAAIGIYGVMSYAVSQRTSEIGIRLALGAESRDILAMIVGNAMRLAGDRARASASCSRSPSAARWRACSTKRPAPIR